MGALVLSRENVHLKLVQVAKISKTEITSRITFENAMNGRRMKKLFKGSELVIARYSVGKDEPEFVNYGVVKKITFKAF